MVWHVLQQIPIWGKENKTKVNRRDLLTLKAVGKTSLEEKGNPQNGKEMFANEDAHKEFISKTDKQLMSSLSKIQGTQ